jgi:hypothetical protein
MSLHCPKAVIVPKMRPQLSPQLRPFLRDHTKRHGRIETLAGADAVIGCTARRSYFDPRAASDLADMARRPPALVVPMSRAGARLFVGTASPSQHQAAGHRGTRYAATGSLGYGRGTEPAAT